jgi:hypothetical protein
MGWFVTVEGDEHSGSCAAPCRVGYKRVAAIEQVQLIVLARAHKCDKQDLARQIASHLPHGQHVDHVLCSRVVRAGVTVKRTCRSASEPAASKQVGNRVREANKVKLTELCCAVLFVS